MVALGRGSSPVDAVPLAATPRAVTALSQSLVALGDLPGARYLLVTDAGGDRVRGELGGPPESDLAVLAWARRLADVSRERGRTMEDVVLTTESSFHLVRCVPGVGEDVWVALRIDRERGNLALARRALAALASGRSGASSTRALPSGPTATPGSSAPTVPGSFAPTGSRSSDRTVSGSFPSPVSRSSDPAVPGPSASRVESDRPRSGRGPDVGPGTGALPVAMPSAGTPMPLAPAPRRTPDAELPRPTARPGADVPALAFLPPSRPTTRPALVAPEEVPPPAAPVVPPSGANGAVRTPDVSNEPSVPPADPTADDDGELHASSGSSAPSSAADPVDGVVRTPDVTDEPFTPTTGPVDDAAAEAPASSSDPEPHPEPHPEPEREPHPEPESDAAPDEPGMWDPRRRPLTVRRARTWRTPSEVPPAREPVEHATPAPQIPAPRTGSLFAPVVVVPPPPSPVDDDTTEVPAPVPYPIITAPPLEPAPAPVVTAPRPAPEEEQVVPETGLPRRVPGAQLRSPTPAPDPVPAAAPAGIPGWSTEPSVLRRLLTGLRRLT